MTIFGPGIDNPDALMEEWREQMGILSCPRCGERSTCPDSCSCPYDDDLHKGEMVDD